MSIGKLYKLSDGEFIGCVNYRLLSGEVTSWWGELTLEDYVRLDDGDGFIIELEDKRRSQCRLTKRVNRAVSGVPPRWTYHITGTSPLE
ncbi:hypothetical protein ES703_62753 [subsurface metagenome]